MFELESEQRAFDNRKLTGRVLMLFPVATGFDFGACEQMPAAVSEHAYSLITQTPATMALSFLRHADLCHIHDAGSPSEVEQIGVKVNVHPSLEGLSSRVVDNKPNGYIPEQDPDRLVCPAVHWIGEFKYGSS